MFCITLVEDLESNSPSCAQNNTSCVHSMPATPTPQNSPYPPDSSHSPASLVFSASSVQEADITSVIPNLTTDGTVLSNVNNSTNNVNNSTSNVNNSTTTGNAKLTPISMPLTYSCVLGRGRSRNDTVLHCYIYLRFGPKSGLAKLGISMDSESKMDTRFVITVQHLLYCIVLFLLLFCYYVLDTTQLDPLTMFTTMIFFALTRRPCSSLLTTNYWLITSKQST